MDAISGGGRPKAIDLCRFCPADYVREQSDGGKSAANIGESKYEDSLLCFQRRNEMLGLGLVGTVIVGVVIVWLIRMV